MLLFGKADIIERTSCEFIFVDWQTLHFQMRGQTLLDLLLAVTPNPTPPSLLPVLDGPGPQDGVCAGLLFPE